VNHERNQTRSIITIVKKPTVVYGKFVYYQTIGKAEAKEAHVEMEISENGVAACAMRNLLLENRLRRLRWRAHPASIVPSGPSRAAVAAGFVS
jgi:hypothetical protein